jgi:hypothetical protein
VKERGGKRDGFSVICSLGILFYRFMPLVSLFLFLFISCSNIYSLWAHFSGGFSVYPYRVVYCFDAHCEDMR